MTCWFHMLHCGLYVSHVLMFMCCVSKAEYVGQCKSFDSDLTKSQQHCNPVGNRS